MAWNAAERIKKLTKEKWEEKWKVQLSGDVNDGDDAVAQFIWFWSARVALNVLEPGLAAEQ